MTADTPESRGAAPLPEWEFHQSNWCKPGSAFIIDKTVQPDEWLMWRFPNPEPRYLMIAGRELTEQEQRNLMQQFVEKMNHV